MTQTDTELLAEKDGVEKEYSKLKSWHKTYHYHDGLGYCTMIEKNLELINTALGVKKE